MRNILPSGVCALIVAVAALLGPRGEAAAENSPPEESKPAAPVTSEHPTVTEYAKTVAKGRVQLEGWTELISDKELDWSAISLLGRFGFTDWFELQLGTSAFRFDSLRVQKTQLSWLDRTWIGGRFATGHGDHLSLAVQPVLELADAAQTNAPATSVGVVGSLGLDDQGPVGLTFNLAVENIPTPALEDDRGFEYRGSMLADVDLPGLLGAFIEFEMVVSPGQAPETTGNLGLNLRLFRRLQIDARGGLDVAERRAWSVGLGASYLL